MPRCLEDAGYACGGRKSQDRAGPRVGRQQAQDRRAWLSALLLYPESEWIVSPHVKFRKELTERIVASKVFTLIWALNCIGTSEPIQATIEEGRT